MRTLSIVLRPGFQLLLLAMVMAAAGFARTAVGPLQEAMRMALILSDNEMALLQGPAIGIPIALTAIPLGLLIDRSSRVRLLLALVLFALMGSLFTAFASGFIWLLIARCVAGVAALAIVPVVYSLGADLYPPEKRGRVLTVASIGQVAGNSAAFALGGTLLTLAGAAPDAWRWVILWLTVPLLPVLLLMLALREPTRTGIAIDRPSARQVWKELGQYRSMIVPLMVGIILAESAVGAILIWAAPMLSRNFRLPPDRIGGIMAIGMLISGIAGPAIGGLLADLCQRAGGPARTVATLTGLALLSVPAGLFAFVPGVVTGCILLVSSMTLMLAIAVMGMTLFTIVIPNELRGLCMSALVATNIFFCLAVAPPTVSLLSGAIGGLSMIGKALSIVCVAIGVLAASTFAWGRRSFSRPAGRWHAQANGSEAIATELQYLSASGE
jgi:predicted MFS family arabinose efflux permease